MTVVKNLVTEIVDYAGLFPPAKLPLDEVIENFEQYLNSDCSWMLSRLVLPIGKVAELGSHPTFVQSSNNWKISALLPVVADRDAFDAAMLAISEFNQHHESKAIIDNAEIKTPTVESVQATASRMPDGLQAFFEIPHAGNPMAHLAAIAGLQRTNIFAKIRTGGITPDLIPSAADVAQFIVCCAERNIGLKATAGLHHPIRGDFRLTYDDNSEHGMMFGFLNVFIAGCFAFAGQSNIEFLEQILTANAAENFVLTDREIRFGNNSISAEQIQSIRRSRLTTFGSCSFTEPTSELAELGWLEKRITT